MRQTFVPVHRALCTLCTTCTENDMTAGSPSLPQMHTNSGWQAHSRCCCLRQHAAIIARWPSHRQKATCNVIVATTTIKEPGDHRSNSFYLYFALHIYRTSFRIRVCPEFEAVNFILSPPHLLTYPTSKFCSLFFLSRSRSAPSNRLC